MSNFKIEVKPKKEIIELNFEIFKNQRGRYHIRIYDKLGRSTQLTFDKIRTFVPSTLLSRWVSFFMKDKLMKLAGKGSSVEYAVKGGGGTWKYRDTVQYFGLHDIVAPNGDTLRVSIDDSIGMKKVVDIVNGIGYSVFVDYDTEKNRTNKIILEEIKYA
ncbi:hypothetical protein vBAbaMD22_52 [Acinetobacter phage vB_AbaM_D22]|nr:hypothetical protein vBAbaMD22_52 [Acinetobacter phage vB_AbaM_D22]